MFFVKPGDGRAPRDPNTGLFVPPEGQRVSVFDASWHFLLRHGDVVEAEEPAAPAAAPAPAAAAPAPNFEEHG